MEGGGNALSLAVGVVGRGGFVPSPGSRLNQAWGTFPLPMLYRPGVGCRKRVLLGGLNHNWLKSTG